MSGEERKAGEFPVLFFDADGCLKEGGELRSESLAALQALVGATGAEVVLTSGSRFAEVSRVAMKEGLNR